jgi:prevent-host-death family protein
LLVKPVNPSPAVSDQGCTSGGEHALTPAHGTLYDVYEMYETDNKHASGHVSVSEARETFADVVNRVAYRNERLLVTRRGKPIAAIIPMEQVEFLERAEDEFDIRMANEALAELEHTPAIPWEQVKRELGL